MDNNKTIKYTYNINSNESVLLRNLIQTLCSKEGFVTLSQPISKHGAFRLLFGESGDEPLVRFDCGPAPNNEYNLEFVLLKDEPQAHKLLATLTEFVSQWYTEMRKSFFR